jgi:uncharacterized repeat protein (TIGR01451 family)
LVGVLAGSGALAAPTLRYSVDQRGDVLIIGNTLGHDCANAAAPIVPGAIPNTTAQCGSNRTDSGIDVLWRSDAPSSGTAMANTSITVANARSTAVLSIPSGATITYARLYWAAQEQSGAADLTVTVDRQSVFSADVTADASFTATYSGGQFFYQSTADVTSLVQANGNGAYRLSGVSAGNPVNLNNEVNFAAWAMVVFYSLSSEPPRNLALFDGLDVVEPGSPASATVSGFLVPNSGYAARLGVIAYEGDSSFSGDTLRFNGTNLSNTTNPSSNFFNATRSSLGSAVSVSGDLPQLTGAAGSMSGIDMDVIDVTSLVSPGATSATTTADSTQDVYLIGAMVTSISTLKPIFTSTSKSFVDLNGGLVLPGDTVEYRITTANTGTDTATDVFVTDPLPEGITYVAGSLAVEGTVLTDASGDDQGEYVAGTRTVKVRIGTGANASQGGTISAGGTAGTIVFRATVDANATGTITNLAAVTATGQVGGQTQTFSSGNGIPLAFIVAPDTTIGSGPAASTASSSATFDFASSTSGVTFECRLDGAASFTACSDPATFGGLSEAAHTLEVRAVYSGVADPSPASWAWAVDMTAPGTSIDSAPASLSAQGDAFFEVISEEWPVTYECSLDGAAYSPCPFPLGYSGLADGPHQLSVRAVDAAGNFDPTPAQHAWTIDSTSPAAPSVSIPADGQIFATSTPVFSGTAEPGAQVTVSAGGSVLGVATAASDGSWSFTVPAPLPEGASLVEIVATDAAGNSSPVAARTFTIDTVAPEATVSSAPSALTSQSEAVFSFSANESGVSFECSLDGGAFTACGATVTYGSLADGTHSLAVRARDGAGNVDFSPAQHSWVIDTAAPDTAIASGPSDPSVQSSASFAFSSNEGSATFECSVDGGNWSPCASPSTFSGLTAGPHNFAVRATDGAGNFDPSPAAYSWLIDSDGDRDGLLDVDEPLYRTDPAVPDTDHDGLLDGVEVASSALSPLDADTDDDGLLDGAEDADHDGVKDADETDPAAFDTDGDGLSDGLERGLNVPERVGADTDPSKFAADADPTTVTDPLVDDSDQGSVLDGYEDANRNGRIDSGETDPSVATDDVDADGDGIDNALERSLDLDPFDGDSDDDGVADGADGIADTDGDGRIDALDEDSDNDGLFDGTELGVTDATRPADTDTWGGHFRPDADPSTRTNPRAADSDDDGLADGGEDEDGNGRADPGEADPLSVDTDRGGVADGVERAHGMNPTDDVDDWGVAGGGCSAGGGSIAPLGMVVVLAAARLRRRQRRDAGGSNTGASRAPGRLSASLLGTSPAPNSASVSRALGAPASAAVWLARIASLLLGLMPLAARAQTPISTAIDVQQFKPAPGARDLLAVHSASIATENLDWSAGVASHFAAAPLSMVNPIDPSIDRPIVDHQLTVDVLGSIAFFGRYELGVQLPITLQSLALDALAGEPLQSSGAGDLRIVPKARIWGNETLAVAAGLPIVIPTGGARSFLGGAGVSLQPRAIAEWSPGAVRVLLNVGLNFRGERTLHNLSVGNQFTYAVGVDVPLGRGAQDFFAAAMVGGSMGLGQNDSEERPLELLAAVTWSPLPSLGVYLGGGPGLGHGYGTPAWRGMLGVSWTAERQSSSDR